MERKLIEQLVAKTLSANPGLKDRMRLAATMLNQCSILLADDDDLSDAVDDALQAVLDTAERLGFGIWQG